MKLQTIPLLASMALTAAAQGRAKGVNFYSLDRERELGRVAAEELQRRLPVVNEPAIDAYIARLGGGLAAYANSPFAYTFILYNDRAARTGSASPAAAGPLMPADAFEGEAIEPVSVSGGTIFVPLSLLADAPNEAVFAFQLAHAMAHVALRHATKGATRANLLGIAAKAQNIAAAGVPQGSTPLGALSFERAFERQADYTAAGMASQAGYGPEAMAAYLSAQPEPRNAALSPRIAPKERVQEIHAAVKGQPPAPARAASAGFTEAIAIAARLR
jgi:predicted Zn-dependent protease